VSSESRDRTEARELRSHNRGSCLEVRVCRSAVETGDEPHHCKGRPRGTIGTFAQAMLER